VALIKRYSKSKKPEVKVGIRGDDKITEILKGKIDFIDNISNSSTGTVAMRAVVDNEKGLIFPGSFVSIELFLGEYDVLAVHPDQISQDQEGSYVYVINADNEVHAVHIKPLFGNNDLMLVGDSLKPGDRVVVGVISGLTEGSKVAPTEVPNPVKVKK
jgi:multidrug efflux system membrane fusion protein